jgi:hypothetical protein
MQCYCDNSYGLHQAVPEGECNTPCKDSQEMCGGLYRNSVYEITWFEPSDVIQSLIDFHYIGCFMDGPNRDLSGEMTNMGGAASVNLCAQLCAGFNVFGLQYYGQCFCDNNFGAGGAASEDECALPCTGDDTKICGGLWRNSVYAITANHDTDAVKAEGVEYRYVGCFIDGPTRDLSADPTNMGADASASACADVCFGYSYFGLQSSSHCFCGNSYGSLGRVLDDECHAPCAGEMQDMCGGSWRNAVYEITAAPRLDTVATGLSFSYVGCFIDGEESRDLSHRKFNMGAQATAAACADLCGGSAYFGLQHYHDCYCGAEFGSLGRAANEGECDTPCEGDPDAMCGGNWRNSVYELSGAYLPDVLDVSPSYSYAGCYVDAEDRDLTAVGVMMMTEASAEQCAQYCFGFGYFALQHLNLCFCDNSFGKFGAAINEDECSMPCEGEPNRNCGGSWRNSVYSMSPRHSDIGVSSSLSSTMSSRVETLPVVVNRTPNGTQAKLEYRGCYFDRPTRDMSARQITLAESASPQVCAAVCANYSYFGLQEFHVCFCDNNFGDFGEAPRDHCNTPCEADPGVMCGGPWHNSVYRIIRDTQVAEAIEQPAGMPNDDPSCSEAQQVAITQCIQNCPACDRIKTESVLGSCITQSPREYGPAVEILIDACGSNGGGPPVDNAIENGQSADGSCLCGSRTFFSSVEIPGWDEGRTCLDELENACGLWAGGGASEELAYNHVKLTCCEVSAADSAVDTPASGGPAAVDVGMPTGMSSSTVAAGGDAYHQMYPGRPDARRQQARALVEQVAANRISGFVTYRLIVGLPEDARSVYSLYGTSDSELYFPAAYQKGA